MWMLEIKLGSSARTARVLTPEAMPPAPGHGYKEEDPITKHTKIWALFVFVVVVLLLFVFVFCFCLIQVFSHLYEFYSYQNVVIFL